MYKTVCLLLVRIYTKPPLCISVKYRLCLYHTSEQSVLHGGTLRNVIANLAFVIAAEASVIAAAASVIAAEASVIASVAYVIASAAKQSHYYGTTLF